MRLVDMIYTEEEMQELREENKKLKSDLAFKNTMLDNVSAEYDCLQDVIKKLKEELEKSKECWKFRQEENKKLKEENSYRKKIADIIPQDEKSVAEETIQDLQERIRFLEQCLDNKEKVNKSLREENKRLSDFLECEA